MQATALIVAARRLAPACAIKSTGIGACWRRFSGAGASEEPVADPDPQTPSGGGSTSTETVTRSVSKKVIFTAPSLAEQLKATRFAISNCTFTTAGGLGLAMLGIAPFTPPNAFAIGLALAALQVRLANDFAIGQAKLHGIRHVVELEAEIEESSGDSKDIVLKSIKATCDGGVVRHWKLADASEIRPSLASVLEQGRMIISLDKSRGKADDAEVLDLVLKSDRYISKEEVESSGEDAKDVDALPKLDAISADELKRFSRTDDGRSPADSLAKIISESQMLSLFLLVGGSLVCVGGRSAAERPRAPEPAKVSATQ